MAIFRSADSAVITGLRRGISLTAVLSWIFSALVFLFLFGLAGFFIRDGLPVLQKEGWHFFLKADWYYRASRFGAASMIYGSAVVAAIAIFFAVPLAWGSAILTAEYLGHGRGIPRLIIKSVIELLAGIPSVVYGLLGILFLRPFIFELMKPFHPETGDNLLTAGLLVGMMILPTVMSLSDDAFRSVPRTDRETARALGLTRQETFFHAVFPKALPGLIAAVLLGLGRALGETIAVYLVVGRADNRLPHPWHSLHAILQAGQTLTSKLGGSEINIAYGNPGHWSAIAGLGLILFAVVIGTVFIGESLLLAAGRYR